MQLEVEKKAVKGCQRSASLRMKLDAAFAEKQDVSLGVARAVLPGKRERTSADFFSNARMLSTYLPDICAPWVYSFIYM